MSTQLGLANYADVSRDKDPAARAEHSHHMRLYATAISSIVLLLSLALYGFNYYILSAADRPFSPKHVLLKPSGSIGIKLGMLGFCLFLAIFVYPLRKRIKWLGRQGSARHWLDFHIIFGLTAPVVIAFHSSFKFQGIAGMAFWIMTAVALSGIAGRYIYAQIPRSLNSAELSLKDLAGLEEELTAELSDQSVVSAAAMEPIFRMPSSEQVRSMPAVPAMLLMVMLDLARPLHVARLRLRVLSVAGTLLTLGGLLRTSDEQLERVIRTARRKSSLSKRIVFLQRSQQVFHLWHVIHRPFSYSFAVLAVIHIAVAISLGYL